MNSLHSLVMTKVEYRPASHFQKCTWCFDDATCADVAHPVPLATALRDAPTP
jgi:hypothetical protein